MSIRPVTCGVCENREHNQAYNCYTCGHPEVKEHIEFYQKVKGPHPLVKVDLNKKPPYNCPIKEN